MPTSVGPQVCRRNNSRFDFYCENDDRNIKGKDDSESIEEIFSFDINKSLKNEEQLLKKTKIQITKYVADMEGFDKTRKIVIDHFNTLSRTIKWKYAFKNEMDFQIITDSLVSYFNKKTDIELPTELVKLNLYSKTKVATCIKAIFKELGDGNLKNEVKLFEIMKWMSPFKDDTPDQIYKLMNK